MRGGAFMPVAATIQPAFLARGLRRVALELGVVIHEGTRVVELDGERPGWLGGLGSGGRRAPAGKAGRPVRIRTTSAAGGGEVIAGAVVVGMNAWAAAWPSFGRRLVTWSSYIVLTEPIPDRLAEIGWTGGEGLADARFTLHYLRTTRDGRIAIGGGGGRAGFGGRIGPVFTDDARRRRGGGRPATAVPEPARRPHRGRVGRPHRHLRRPPAEHRDRTGAADPLRPRLLRERRRAVGRRRAGAGRAGPRHGAGRSRPGGRRGARRRSGTGVPAGAVPVSRRERDPRGDRPPRDGRGARRRRRTRCSASSRGCPAASATTSRRIDRRPRSCCRCSARLRRASVPAKVPPMEYTWRSPRALRAGCPPSPRSLRE